MTLKELLKSKETILLDGAVGTELEHLGYHTSLPLWSTTATNDAPEVLVEVHREYCNAGVDIITANTFRSSRHTFRKIDRAEDAVDFTSRAIELARDAVASSLNGDILVAASIAPLEDCFDPSVVPTPDVIQAEYEYTARLIRNLEADLCLIETMINFDEAVVISETMQRLGLPYLISFTADEDGNLLDGTPLTRIIETIMEFEPDGVMVNCRQPHILTANLHLIAAMKLGIPFGAYGNITGTLGGETGMIWDRGVEADATYCAETLRWRELGARIFGGCCGTSPDTIRHLGHLLAR